MYNVLFWEMDMISEYYLKKLDKANQQLADQWHLLVKTRSENGSTDNTKLQQLEMAYFHSLQIVLNTVESAINSQSNSQTLKSKDHSAKL
ncbi:hypothetical protein C6497_05030 [Candidatus Poribacteria bacterium]|nr:MAG: hypothetical protein C6497_05030 [Candidatus Poribacteria bacterium]